MVGAKRARKAETPIPPSLCLRLRAPHFYPTNQAANREYQPHPKGREVPSLLELILSNLPKGRMFVRARKTCPI